MLGSNAGAKILNIKFDTEFDAARGRAGAEYDAAARAAILHRIVDQIRKDLVDGFAVGTHRWEGFDGTIVCVLFHDLEINSLAAGNLAETFLSVMQKFDGWGGLGVEAGLAGFHARQSQQVFGEARHAGRIFADDLEKLAVGIGSFGAEIEEGF